MLTDTDGEHRVSPLMILAGALSGLGTVAVVVGVHWWHTGPHLPEDTPPEFRFEAVALAVCSERRCPVLPGTQVDRWGTAILIDCVDGQYRFRSAGRDGRFGTRDDQTRRGCAFSDGEQE